MTDDDLLALIAELGTCGELDNLREPHSVWLADCPDELLRVRADNARLREALSYAATVIEAEFGSADVSLTTRRVRDALEGKAT